MTIGNFDDGEDEEDRGHPEPAPRWWSGDIANREQFAADPPDWEDQACARVRELGDEIYDFSRDCLTHARMATTATKQANLAGKGAVLALCYTRLVDAAIKLGKGRRR